MSPEHPNSRKRYEKPALRYEQTVHAVAGLCVEEPGNQKKNSGQTRTFQPPVQCVDVFT